MTLHGSPPYPLRQHLPMNCDLLATVTRFCSSPSAATAGEPSTGSMPFMKPTAPSLPISDCSSRAPYEEQDDMQWNTFQDCSPYYQENSNYQTCPDSYDNWYQTTVRLSTPAKTANGPSWDCGIPHESSLQYSSACPRSYPHDLSLDINSCIASVGDAYPPSAYHLDPQNQASFSVPQQRRLEGDLLTESLQSLPRMRLGNQQLRPHSPAQSHTSAHSGKLETLLAVSPGSIEGYEAIDCATTNGDETDGDASISSEPYAQLIYKALMSAPAHKMVLKEIYEWFERNTDKARNNSSKGWQNSIRHNLSMNGAFRKVDQLPPSDESKKGFIWVLESSAVNEGVKSTTRYRKSAPNKKIGKSENPAPQRQRSGAKGGKAARKAAKLRRSARLEDSEHYRLVDRNVGSLRVVNRGLSSPNKRASTGPEVYQAASLPYPLQAPLTDRHTSSEDPESFGFGDITGCVNAYPHEPLFYEDSARGEDPISSQYPLNHCKDDFWDLNLLTD